MKGTRRTNSENMLIVPKCKCNSDTFKCNVCETRMILKVYGDSTPCRREGCKGTMYRQ